MTGGDWHDPFAEDPDAVERERRRAEREARRRVRQGSVGDKVAESQEPAAAESPAEAPAPAQPGPEQPAPEQPAPAATQPAGAAPETGERPAPAAEEPPPSRPRRRDGAGTPPPNALLIRRIVAVLIVVGVAAALIFGVTRVIGALDGGDGARARSPKPLKTQDLTIPEGLDRRQIAEIAEETGLRGDYAEASKGFKGFDPSTYGAQAVANLEGFLFPATYELPKKATAKDLIGRQLDAFKANLAEIDLSYAKSRNLNTYDVLKIASMVEREIQVPEERELAAAVIYNRLKAGTPLGIDATIRYEDQNYDEPLLQSRLDTETPYNTRIVPGLPPTPISNPGLASIEAAANPAKSDAFFFVVKPGTCGEHVFVETQAEFDQAEAAYQKALEEQGGSPTDC